MPATGTHPVSSQDGAKGLTTIAGSVGGAGTRVIVKLSRGEGAIRSSGTEHGFGRADQGISNVLGIFANVLGIFAAGSTMIWPGCTLKGFVRSSAGGGPDCANLSKFGPAGKGRS